ncbi:hypothetical protein FOZ63_015950, partial [Perkinsus olseni]
MRKLIRKLGERRQEAARKAAGEGQVTTAVLRRRRRMESEVAEYGPKKLKPADEELPPRPEAVGPKIPGTGDLVIVWQLEGPAEEQLSLGKIDFKPANDEKIVTALPEDVTIGVDREA